MGIAAWTSWTRSAALPSRKSRRMGSRSRRASHLQGDSPRERIPAGELDQALEVRDRAASEVSDRAGGRTSSASTGPARSRATPNCGRSLLLARPRAGIRPSAGCRSACSMSGIRVSACFFAKPRTTCRSLTERGFRRAISTSRSSRSRAAAAGWSDAASSSRH